MSLILVILIVTAFCLWTWTGRRTNRNEPPTVSGALPLIGHAHLLIGDSIKLWRVVKDVSHEVSNTGGVGTAHIGHKTIYVVTDPHDCLTVSNACLQKGYIYEFAKPWLGEGLATGSDPSWKIHRKLLNPAFNQKVLLGFMDVFNKQARRLVKDLEVEVGRGSFDHGVYTRQNALETICLTALGVDITEKSESNRKFVMATEHMFNVIVDRIQKPWLYNDYIYSWSSLKKKQDEYLKILHDMSYTVLQNRKAEYLKNRNNIEEKSEGPKFKPFMDLLLELSIEQGAFNDREIREHVDTIMIGGDDTSASVLMYCILLVGSYPEVQKRIFEEIDEIFGDEDRDVTKQDLSRLCYIEAVLNETLRLYTTFPVIGRWLDRDVKLRNHTLSKGRTCFMLLCGINRHPMWGKDAEEFKPERWLDPATLPKVPNILAGFSMGKRICIGKTFALMTMKTTLAHVFRHYKFKGDITKLELKIDILLKPHSGHHITVERRRNNNTICDV